MKIFYFLIVLLYGLALFLFGVYIRISETLEILSSLVFQQFNNLNVSYDYIIVGGGSAGSIIAHRLSQNERTTVLVLEAGFSGNSWFDIPAVGPLLQQSSVDWKYQTEPQQNAAKSFSNKVVNWPMGRLMGGSGRLNNMIYIRGHPNDYNEWYRGVPDYNYETDILPYFKKAEDHKGIFVNNTQYHSTGGPLVVEDLAFASSVAETFIKAVEALGYPVRDLNGAYNTGFMKAQLNTKAGQRWTPAHTLQTTKKQNLRIHTNAFVHKVLLKDNFEAYAVKFSSLGQIKTVKARKGIILSAGAIGSPKILMQSGIGPAKHLHDVGVKVKLNLPVGNNLQDHVTTGSDLVLLNTTIGVNPFTMLSAKAAFDYFYYGVGPWTLGGCEVVGILDTNIPDTCYNSKITDQSGQKMPEKCFNNKYQTPNLQFMVVPIGASTDGGYHLRKAANFDESVWREYFVPLIGQNVVSILPIVLHPKSRGTVRLLNSNPYSKPVINPNYLKSSYDVEILLKGIDLIKKIIHTSPFQKLGAKLNPQKFPGCEELEFDTRSYWECYVRHFTTTVYHPAGTCKMGNAIADDTVVDYNFAVHQTNKLYVVDASIMPSLTSGNINAAIVMLAEKASDILKRNNHFLSGTCDKWDIVLPKKTC